MKIDLKRGVVPISKAASSIAQLLKRSKDESMPIVVTQKGYPAGVLLSVDLYVELCRAAGHTPELPAGEPSTNE